MNMWCVFSVIFLQIIIVNSDTPVCKEFLECFFGRISDTQDDQSDMSLENEIYEFIHGLNDTENNVVHKNNINEVLINVTDSLSKHNNKKRSNYGKIDDRAVVFLQIFNLGVKVKRVLDKYKFKEESIAEVLKKINKTQKYDLFNSTTDILDTFNKLVQVEDKVKDAIISNVNTPENIRNNSTFTATVMIKNNTNDKTGQAKKYLFEFNGVDLSKYYIDEVYDSEDDTNASDYSTFDYTDYYKDNLFEEGSLYVPPIENNAIYDTTILTTQTTTFQDKFIDLHRFYSFNRSLYDIINPVTEPDYYIHEDKGFQKLEASTEDKTYPWNAAIFIKNTTTSQFEYYCDAALLSSTILITTARCVSIGGAVVQPQDIIVSLGKRSLADVGETEKIIRISEIIVHENFTASGDVIANDLAILRAEDEVTFNEGIRSICLPSDMGFVDEGNGLTTGWAVSGELTSISMKRDKDNACLRERGNETGILFCASYNDDLEVCPSFGGSFIVPAQDQTQGDSKRDQQSKRTVYLLHGLRYGDPAQRGICFDEPVFFTSLNHYLEWINEFLNDSVCYDCY